MAERPNQRRRTRKDLLEAAAQLMKQGKKPSLEEVAEAALVSRATAYRYFPTIEALLLEASLDMHVPSPADVFPDSSGDAVARLEKVDDVFHEMTRANESALRLMLAQTLERSVSGEAPAVPLRQNRRGALIEAALDPHRDEFKPELYTALTEAIAVLIATEATIVFKDVLQVDDAEARRVKRWAIRALVKAARRDA